MEINRQQLLALGYSDYKIKKLENAGILQKCGRGKYQTESEFIKEEPQEIKPVPQEESQERLTSQSRDSVLHDIKSYRKQYYINIAKGRLQRAEELLLKVIDLCEANQIDGDYYYEIASLRCKIKCRTDSDAIGVQLDDLKKKYNFLRRTRKAKEMLEVSDAYCSIDQDRTYKGLYQLGETYFVLSQNEPANKITYEQKAEELLLKAFDTDPYPPILGLLGDIEKGRKNYEKAEEYYRMFLSYDQNTTYSPYIKLIFLYLREKKYTQAEALYIEAITKVCAEGIDKKKFCQKLSQYRDKYRGLVYSNENYIKFKQDYTIRKPKDTYTIRKPNDNYTEGSIEKKINYSISQYNYEQNMMNKIAPNLEQARQILVYPQEGKRTGDQLTHLVSNLQIGDGNLLLFKVKLAELLEEYRYPNLAEIYIRQVEKVKPRPKIVNDELNSYQKHKKLYRNK